MRRGEIYRVPRSGDDLPSDDPKLFRSFVVVSRQVLIDSPIPYRRLRGDPHSRTWLLPPVKVGVDEGLKHESWILCDNLVSLRKVHLTHFVGRWLAASLRNWTER